MFNTAFKIFITNFFHFNYYVYLNIWLFIINYNLNVWVYIILIIDSYKRCISIFAIDKNKNKNITKQVPSITLYTHKIFLNLSHRHYQHLMIRVQHARIFSILLIKIKYNIINFQFSLSIHQVVLLYITKICFLFYYVKKFVSSKVTR